MAHFSGGSTSPWQMLQGVLVAVVRECLRLRGGNVRVHMHNEEQAPPNPPATRKFIDALPHAQLSSTAASMLNNDSVCSICLDEYEDGSEVVVMPCNGYHKFHKACICQWLESASTCPCCKWATPNQAQATELKSTELRAMIEPARVRCESLARGHLTTNYGDSLTRGQLTTDGVVPTSPQGKRRAPFRRSFFRRRLKLEPLETASTSR